MIGRNKTRSDAACARNYGPEAGAVRMMECCVPGCRRFSVAAHVVPRKMGAVHGTRFDLANLCHDHHTEAGEERTTARAEFEQRHRLDLREVADRIAVAHEPPFGIRGVMGRWLAWRKHLAAKQRFDDLAAAALVALAELDGQGSEELHRQLGDAQVEMTAAWRDDEGIEDYEREALFGWAKRWADRSIAKQRGLDAASAHACASVGRALRVELIDAVELLEVAGWRAAS
jgi:hypothetical protein